MVHWGTRAEAIAGYQSQKRRPVSWTNREVNKIFLAKFDSRRDMHIV